MDQTDKIDSYARQFIDWRGDMLEQLRKLINNVSPELTEDFKWGVPVWTYRGLVCAISAFKNHVKINFFKGAFLADPHNIFNSGLESKEHRSINFTKCDDIHTTALTELISSAVSYNNKG